jgi:alcohol dehydrogenase class IV
VDPPGPVIVRPTNSGAKSEATPMAILPRAKPTAKSLPSTDRIVRDRFSAARPDASW